MAAPVVTSISPASGPGDARTTVTLYGSGFGGATLITFEFPAPGTPEVMSPPDFAVINDGIIVLLTLDNHSDLDDDFYQYWGPVHITVTSPDGTSAQTAADEFTYIEYLAGVVPVGQLDRVALGSDASLVLTPVDDEGANLSLDSPATVQISDGGGVVIDTVAATISDDDSSIMVTIPTADLALLDTYSLLWTASASGTQMQWATELETCGGFYFTLAQYRAQGKEFSDAAAADIRRLRTSVEQFIDDRCEQAFVSRGAREVIQGDGTPTLVVSNKPVTEIYSIAVTQNGVTTTWTTPEIGTLGEAPSGMLQLPGYWAGVWAPGAEQPDVWPNGATIAIHYAYGLDHPSAKMSRAAAYLARLEAFPDTRMPPNAVLQSTEFGNFRIATPDKDHPTGIPWIDELLDREGHYIPAVG